MPMTESQREVLNLYKSGMSQRVMADKLGLSRGAIRDRLSRALSWENSSSGQREAMEASGLHPGVALHGWRVIQHKDGSRDSVFWKSESLDTETDLEDRVLEKFKDVPPAPRISRPQLARTELRAFYPLFDVHFGRNYNGLTLEQTTRRLVTGMEDLIGRTKAAETAIILNGGDWTEQNDPSNQTPLHKNPLDAHDYDDTIEASIDATAQLIEMALQKHDQVIYKVLRGNHDPHTARILRIGMMQRYRNEPRVIVDTTDIHFMAHEWGSNLICAHHGDLRATNPQKLVMQFAARYHDVWGRTRHRELWTGHNHQLKSQDFPGMEWHQCRPVAPENRYEYESGFHPKSEMLSVLYHSTEGRKTTEVYRF